MATFDARIEIAEDGFFHPLAQAEQDFVDANRFRHIGLSGLPASVQFVRTLVHLRSNEAPSKHIVIWAHYPRMSDDHVARTAAVLRSAFPDTPATFVFEVVLNERGDVYHV